MMLKNDAPPLHINCDNCHTGHHRCATPHVLSYKLTFVSDWVEGGIIVSVINMSLSVFKASPFQHATFLQSCFQRQRRFLKEFQVMLNIFHLVVLLLNHISWRRFVILKVVLMSEILVRCPKHEVILKWSLVTIRPTHV